MNRTTVNLACVIKDIVSTTLLIYEGKLNPKLEGAIDPSTDMITKDHTIGKIIDKLQVLIYG